MKLTPGDCCKVHRHQWSGSYLYFCTSLLSASIELQRKIQEEIDSKVGTDRPVTGEDKPNLPYTNAAIMELLRITSLAPLGAPHMTLKDTEIGGYSVPQGTTVGLTG